MADRKILALARRLWRAGTETYFYKMKQPMNQTWEGMSDANRAGWLAVARKAMEEISADKL